jgi:hypothetical protein
MDLFISGTSQGVLFGAGLNYREEVIIREGS